MAEKVLTTVFQQDSKAARDINTQPAPAAVAAEGSETPIQKTAREAWDKKIGLADSNGDKTITPEEMKKGFEKILKTGTPEPGQHRSEYAMDAVRIAFMLDPQRQEHFVKDGSLDMKGTINQADIPATLEKTEFTNAEITKIRSDAIAAHQKYRSKPENMKIALNMTDAYIAKLDSDHNGDISIKEMVDQGSASIQVIKPENATNYASAKPKAETREKELYWDGVIFADKAWDLVRGFDTNGDGMIQNTEIPANPTAEQKSGVRYVTDIKTFRSHPDPQAAVNIADAREVANKVLYTQADLEEFLKGAVSSLQNHLATGSITKDEASASYKEAQALVAKLGDDGMATYSEMIKETGGTSLVAKAPLPQTIADSKKVTQAK